MRRNKYSKRLARYIRLSRVRGMNWAMKHVVREAGNARRVYRQQMGKTISKKLATTGLVVSFMLRYDHAWKATWTSLLAYSTETDKELAP